MTAAELSQNKLPLLMLGVDVRTCELFEQGFLLLLQRLPWF
jgi:hypothetical protein